MKSEAMMTLVVEGQQVLLTMEGEDLTLEQQKELNEIRKKKSILIREHRIKKSTAESRPIVLRKFDKTRDLHMREMVIIRA